MGTEADRSGPGRFVRPHALFLGAACAFAACCLAGRLLCRHNLYRDFSRFHALINPESLYRPTASQLLALAESRLAPDQVAVVVAGNSVMRGSGQGPEDLWTGHLQRLLGGRYRVVNFGLDNAAPGEFGALVAEALSRRHPRVVCVTDTWPGIGPPWGVGPGADLYPYFFWDAYCKGLLTRHPERETFLAWWPAGEARWHGRLDAAARFDDLWTAVGYRGVSTVWCPLVRDAFWRARRGYPDPERTAPPADRGREGVRAQLPCLCKTLPFRHWDGDPPGSAAPGPGVPPLVRYFSTSFPEPLRRRTLVLVMRVNPWLEGEMEPAARDRLRGDYPETVRALERAGFAAAELGRGFAETDYADSVHLGAAGAVKLAADVAPRVRFLARDWDRAN